MNNMLTLEEVKNFLEVSQEDLEKHLQTGKLRAYKIGGTYIRFRKEEVLNLRSEYFPKKSKTSSPSFGSRISDFWQFNNFYIISILIVIGLIVVIAKY
jgi:excisionase family DNA binding protein